MLYERLDVLRAAMPPAARRRCSWARPRRMTRLVRARVVRPAYQDRGAETRRRRAEPVLRPAGLRRRRPVLHRPDRAAQRRPRSTAGRLAGAGGRAVLPRYPAGAVRRDPPPSPAHCGQASREPRRRRARPGRSRSSPSLTGEAALLASLRRGRTGRMGDIVATIQADQDRIIREDRRGILVVEGGPGTGKTVVALHRAAYLLYTYRKQLARRGILVIGPNATFLRYIDQVLPSLGENDVVLATVGVAVPWRRRSRPRITASRAGQGRRQDGGRAGEGRRGACASCRPPRRDQGMTAPPTGSRLAFAARPAQKPSDASIPTPDEPLPHNAARRVFIAAIVRAWPGSGRGSSVAADSCTRGRRGPARRAGDRTRAPRRA